LDNEASEDEAARKDFFLTRPISHEANVELIEKASRYRNILAEASKSDELIRQKWDEWEESIAELTLDEVIAPFLQKYWTNLDQRVQATLEASVPSSTLSSLVTRQSKQTRQNAQGLRVKLEELDTVHRDCDQLVHRAQSLVAADNIRPRIVKMASGFERLASVTPAMFESILDEELAKFDKYLSELTGMKRKHEELLNEIQV
jgi:programmed cell death 6-interacting protein